MAARAPATAARGACFRPLLGVQLAPGEAGSPAPCDLDSLVDTGGRGSSSNRVELRDGLAAGNADSTLYSSTEDTRTAVAANTWGSPERTARVSMSSSEPAQTKPRRHDGLPVSHCSSGLRRDVDNCQGPLQCPTGTVTPFLPPSFSPAFASAPGLPIFRSAEPERRNCALTAAATPDSPAPRRALARNALPGGPAAPDFESRPPGLALLSPATATSTKSRFRVMVVASSSRGPEAAASHFFVTTRGGNHPAPCSSPSSAKRPARERAAVAAAAELLVVLAAAAIHRWWHAAQADLADTRASS